ncbi:MAG: hypothetical protein AB8F95_09405 [Bacteroidia bacterium]
MPSSILQTPLWLQAEQELRNQLMSFNEVDSDVSNVDIDAYTDTTLGRHEAEFAQKGIKAAASLGAARHAYTFITVLLTSSVAFLIL